MNKPLSNRRPVVWMVGALTLTLLALAATEVSRADNDEDEHGERHSRSAASQQLINSPGYKTYQQECAGCHMAYPPGMLPPASWQRIMGSLDQHYGTNASLDAPTVRELSAWLATQSAQSTGKRRASEPPPQDRITRSSWFVHEHDEISASVWKRASIKSPANCMACHTQSKDGQPNFSEHAVRIPAK